MQTATPWHARLARALAIVLPIFLACAALGTKFGLWGWQLGLGAFGLGGLILIGLTALTALVSIALILRKRSRLGLVSSIFALLVALGFVGLFAPAILGGGQHPIHDMATDTANPPQFSPETLAARAQAGANPLNPYDAKLGETEQFAEAEGALAQQTTAEVIATNYPELEPLGINETPANEAVNAVQLAMADMGFSGIRYFPESGTVEGLAETFWFGFEDDVVARIADGQIDFRSVSRVGRSDLGANAKRIMELRRRVAERLGLNP
jgi:fatty-acyl-CoA synthase